MEYIKREKYVCGRAISIERYKRKWRTSMRFLPMAVLGIHPQACQFLKLNHHIYSSCEKSIIERTIQYIKNRTECFDDYFTCRKKNCKLKHVQKWLNLYMHIIVTRREYLNFRELFQLFRLFGLCSAFQKMQYLLP